MTEKNGPGQADKAAAEKKTAAVGAENKANADAQRLEAQKAEAQPDNRVDSRQPPTGDGDVAAPVDSTPARADGGPARPAGLDPSIAPYPQYEDEPVDALRSLAEGRGVEINRDVEKSFLVKALREKDREGLDLGPDRDDTRAADASADSAPDDAYPSYDFMPLEELRSLAKARDVGMKPVDEKAHLVGELRANDSGVNTSSPTPGTTV